MKTSDFYFYLPEELIAQHPLEKRDYSKLMVLDKETGKIEHKHFYNVIEYLNPGDTLVLNNTRVMPARLIGEKAESGGKIEFLLLKRIEGDKWECLAKPGKRAKIGTEFVFGKGKLKCKVVDIVEEGNRIIEAAEGRSRSVAQAHEHRVRESLQPYLPEQSRRLYQAECRTPGQSAPSAGR